MRIKNLISNTKGIDEDKRDEEMIELLRECCADKNKEFLLVVLGLGCDGESSAERLRKCVEEREKEGGYLGCFLLSELMFDSFRTTTHKLKRSRTTNIMLDAYEGKLTDKIVKGRNCCEIPRGERHVIPVEWLTRGFILK